MKNDLCNREQIRTLVNDICEQWQALKEILNLNTSDIGVPEVNWSALLESLLG